MYKSPKILEDETHRHQVLIDKAKVFSSLVVCLCTFNDRSLIALPFYGNVTAKNPTRTRE